MKKITFQQANKVNQDDSIVNAENEETTVINAEYDDVSEYKTNTNEKILSNIDDEPKIDAMPNIDANQNDLTANDNFLSSNERTFDQIIYDDEAKKIEKNAPIKRDASADNNFISFDDKTLNCIIQPDKTQNPRSITDIDDKYSNIDDKYSDVTTNVKNKPAKNLYNLFTKARQTYFRSNKNEK